MNKLNDELTKHNTKLTFYAIKESRGITLVVLIITIVVLLILAGITIANITGGDGVIEQASHKKDETTIANEKQILGNAVITASDKFGEITENNLLQALSNQNVEITKSGGLYRIVFKDTNNLYKMNKDGEFFYWEDMAPTDIYAKKDGTTLYLRSTKPDTSYVKGTQWNDSSITKVVIEEPIAPTTCENMFIGCSSLQTLENIENLHTENATSFEKMFYGCNNLKSLNLFLFDTLNVSTMNLMFYSCANLQQIDLSSFDTSNLETANGMFRECHGITLIDLSSFNTENLKNSVYMFYNCQKLKTILVGTSWTSDNITESNFMFSYDTNLQGDKGTKYSSSNTNKTYARVDNPPDEPGYFTLKQ